MGGTVAASRENCVDSAQVAAQFRQFSSLTPERLRGQRWLHPFTELARREARVRRRLEFSLAESDSGRSIGEKRWFEQFTPGAVEGR